MKCNHPGCNNNTTINKSTGQYKKYCSSECRYQDPNLKAKIAKSTKKTYTDNADAILAKRSATNQRKYNADNPMQNQAVQQARKQTLEDRYGSSNLMQIPDVKRKRQHTFMEKYGVSESFLSKDIQQKRRQTLFEKYGTIHSGQTHLQQEIIDNLNDIDFLVEQNQHKSVRQISKELGLSQNAIWLLFRRHGIKPITHYNQSLFENEVSSYLDQFDTKVELHSRILPDNKEIDIYLPEHNIGIECNGTYWHSELQGRGKHYHIEKSRAANSAGIKLLHIWEYDWNDPIRKNIVKNRLLVKLNQARRVFARNCQLVDVDFATYKTFMENNHLQGVGNIPSIIHGLVYDNQLVAIMSFGRSRYTTDAKWELLRFASTGNMSVIGGATKLFRHFVRNHPEQSVVSYAHLDWNTGNVYQHMGFVHIRDSAPGYHYTRDYVILNSRQLFQKHKLPKLLEKFDPDKTEWENMKMNGYDRIWNCGNRVWLYA